jgi:hypothetical protein
VGGELCIIKVSKRSLLQGLGIYVSGKVIVLLFTIAACIAVTGITLTAVGFAESNNTPFSRADEEENFYTRHMVSFSGNPMTIAGPILIIVGGKVYVCFLIDQPERVGVFQFRGGGVLDYSTFHLKNHPLPGPPPVPRFDFLLSSPRLDFQIGSTAF